MSINTTIQEKALRAAANYLERRGFEVIDTEWVPEDGFATGSIDVVARDEETIVFVDVTAKIADQGGFESGADRAQMELLAASWLKDNAEEGNYPVRFDKLSMLVLNDDRALLRHHINAYGEA